MFRGLNTCPRYQNPQKTASFKRLGLDLFTGSDSVGGTPGCVWLHIPGAERYVVDHARRYPVQIYTARLVKCNRLTFRWVATARLRFDRFPQLKTVVPALLAQHRGAHAVEYTEQPSDGPNGE